MIAAYHDFHLRQEIFNPYEQLKRFDPKGVYVKRWVPEMQKPNYPKPIVEHKFARLRALERYQDGIS